MENNLRNYEEFAAHIQDEVYKARREVTERIGAITETSVGCVDPLTKEGAWNPPGGLVFLYAEGWLEEYIAARRGKGGFLAAHLRCGYMLVIMSENRAVDQKRIIEQAKADVVRLNEQYGTSFRVEVEKQGSAAAYMK